MASLARAGTTVLIGYVVARALGYVRFLAYAAVFGAGMELDAFSIAFRLPDLILNLVASGALAAAVVGPVSHALAAGGLERASRATSGLLTWAAIAFALFGVGLFIAAPAVVPLLAPGFPRATTDLAIQLTREMSPAPLLLGLGGMVSGVLQADRRFGPAVLGPIAYNVISVASSIVLSGPLGAHALSVGVVGGSAVYLLVQLAGLRPMGLRLRPVLDVSDPEVRRSIGLLGPRAYGLSIDQLKLILALAAASTLPTGSVTAFAVAYTIFQIPAGTLAVPLGTIVLPEMAAQHAAGAAAALARLAASAVRLVLFLVLPITALAVGLAAELADLLFGHGRYDDASVALTSSAVAILFLGLPAAAISSLASRTLYATERTVTSVAAATVDLAITGGLLLVLPLTAGLAGIAAAFTIGGLAAATLLVTELVRRVPGPAWRRTLRPAARSAALAILAGLVSAGIADVLLPLDAPPHGPIAGLIVVGVAGGAGAATYLGISWRLRAPELLAAQRLVRQLRRRAAHLGDETALDPASS